MRKLGCHRLYLVYFDWCVFLDNKGPMGAQKVVTLLFVCWAFPFVRLGSPIGPLEEGLTIGAFFFFIFKNKKNSKIYVGLGIFQK